ncbi:MAG: ATP-binding cassette domain-containing protein [Lachnospiraceae bacterium]|nr:ATP-binding cassette domain-containing protein [Lachnospiraceae bacterium]
MEILRVEDLKFAYRIRPDKQALDGVSFALNKGDLLCVCGATGGGKSTLLKMLKKELTPSGEKSGRVMICGKSPDEMSERESAATVGFVMQRPEQQIVTDKVWHELAFGLENLAVPQKEIRRRVSEIAGYFGIESWFEMNTDELSGGQKQLLNLAAVMVMQPEILVLDEPTAQLDPIAASNFIATVVKLNRELALTVVIVEHRLEDIIPVSDKLLVLEDGKVRAFGPTRECVGQLIGDERLLKSMPAAVRVFAATKGDINRSEIGEKDSAECAGTAKKPYIEKSGTVLPLDVCEGRSYIEDHFGNEIRSETASVAEASDGEYALEFKEVYLRYSKDGSDVLRGMDLKVRKGEIFCILGGNGAGKSTAVSAAAGLVKPYSGQIKVFGKKLKEYHGQELYRNCVAMLPQDVQTVFTEDNYEGRHPYDLSGGEQQLAALKIVLETDPRLLILDEPTKGIDVYAAEQRGKKLRELADKGVTVVIVTHDVEFAARLADRCALLFNGEITSCDSAKEFFADNYFYTTAANRMTRGFYDGVVTAEDAVRLCRLNAH